MVSVPDEVPTDLIEVYRLFYNKKPVIATMRRTWLFHTAQAAFAVFGSFLVMSCAVGFFLDARLTESMPESLPPFVVFSGLLYYQFVKKAIYRIIIDPNTRTATLTVRKGRKVVLDLDQCTVGEYGGRDSAIEIADIAGKKAYEFRYMYFRNSEWVIKYLRVAIENEPPPAE